MSKQYKTIECEDGRFLIYHAWAKVEIEQYMDWCESNGLPHWYNEYGYYFEDRETSLLFRLTFGIQ